MQAPADPRTRTDHNLTSKKETTVMRRLLFILVALSLMTFGILIPNAPPASGAVGDELLLNPGLEAPDPSAPGLGPQYWIASTWGTLTGATSYVGNDGHTGTHSVRVDISTWTVGDSKWLPAAAVPVTGGAYYTFSDWYKSDVSTAVSVYYETATDLPDNGRWANLFSGIAPASSWTQFKTGFTMPTDAVRAYFVHFVARPGYLQTDDYSMTEAARPPGFGRPLVSLTFDDGSEGFYQNALPLLNAKGYKTTQYVPTQGLGTGDTFMMTPAQIKELYQAGHEIGSHSITHPDLTTVPDAQLASELQASKTSLEAIVGGGKVVSFAYPFGAYDARVIAAERAVGYASGRSVEVGYNTKGDLEPFDIRVQNMTPATTQAEFASWLAYAKAHNYWLVIVYHEVQPDAFPVCTNPDTEDNCIGPYDTTVSGFTSQLNAVAAAGLGPNVVTVQQALAEIGSGTTAPPPPVVSGGPPGAANGTKLTRPPATARPAPAGLTARLAVPRQRLRSVLGHGLRVLVSSSRAGTAQVRVLGGASTARRLGLGRRATVVGSATAAVSGPGERTITVRLTQRARRALARVRAVSLTARLVVTAGGGEQTRTSAHIALRR